MNSKFDKLIEEMSKCTMCTNLGNKSLINFYGDDIAKKIPSIWTDWYNHLSSDIMIIGQDWGPYKDMVRLYERYKNGEDYQSLIDSEKSLTKRKLFKFLLESAKLHGVEINYDDFYITNAIMCARMGDSYRGNNINLKYSTCSCMRFLKTQIDIVKPKVILSLGYYPLLSLSYIYNFTIEDNLTRTIDNISVIDLDGIIIIPVYHPTAQVSNERQMIQYNKIWSYLLEK